MKANRFFSRKLSAPEKNYSVYDRELLSVFAAINYFQHLLESRQFVIKTDHKPLTYVFAQRLDKASPRQLLQLDYISQFSTEIVHIKGEQNVVADALSRINEINMPSSLTTELIHEEQQQDEELQDLLKSNTSLNLQRLTIDGKAIYCNIADGIVRPYLPQILRQQAFKIIHNLSHPSARVTCHHLKEKYIWPGLKKDAFSWARQCVPCQRAKIQRHNKFVPEKINVPDNRFNHIHIDIIVLPEVRGYKYCLTIIDRFSRWPVAVPIKDMTADTVVTAVYSQWICNFGTPLTITTDQGSQFESSLFTAMAKFIGAKRIRTSPYHPSSNGLIERWHRTLKAALMCNSQIPWIDLLPTVMFGLRTCYKEDLKASVAELLFGTTLRIPGEFFVNVEMPADPQIFVEKHREYMRGIRPTPTAHHSKARMFLLHNIYDCTHVFVRSDSVKLPLEPPYSGPYPIVKRISDSLFVIKIDGTDKTISVERLKPAYICKDDVAEADPNQELETVPSHQWGSVMDKPHKTYQKKVSFLKFFRGEYLWRFFPRCVWERIDEFDTHAL